MLKENIQFETIDKNGNKITSYILATVTKENKVNVIYKMEDDEDDTVRYGSIVKTEDSYELNNDITEKELQELKDIFNNEIKNLFKEIANGENIYEV